MHYLITFLFAILAHSEGSIGQAINRGVVHAKEKIEKHDDAMFQKQLGEMPKGILRQTGKMVKEFFGAWEEDVISINLARNLVISNTSQP